MVSALFFLLAVQAPAGAPVDSVRPPAGFSIPIGVARTGLSVGNSLRWTGFRLNLRDANVQRVTGVSVSLWKAKQDGNRDAKFNALSVGLVGAFCASA